MNSDGSVNRIGSKTIDNIRQVLDSAYNYGIVVSLCLFSFDLLQLDGKNATMVATNKKFLTSNANLDSYITKVLNPILEAVGNHPAIMCWEVFNEPEGMSSDAGGWSDGDKVPMSDILRITARIAAVVHNKTLKMASTGIHEYGKMKTWYSDSQLRTAAGNDPLAQKAYLDFYMAHYYPEYIGTSGSPFHHPASYWGMDRPILIGEFPAKNWDSGYYTSIQQGTGMTVTAAYEYAYNNGYCGALSWSMNQAPSNKFGDFSTTKPALQNLYSKPNAKADIDGVSVSGGQSSSSTATAASSSSRASSSSVAVLSSSSRASSSSGASSSSTATAASSSSKASSSSAAVSSSSSSTQSSSSSDANASSSSSEDTTPIASHSPLTASHSPAYYSLKGEPLGSATPQKAGVYIVKQGHSVKKIVVR